MKQDGLEYQKKSHHCLKEISVMLGGPQYTETSLDSARELIQRAKAWKEATA